MKLMNMFYNICLIARVNISFLVQTLFEFDTISFKFIRFLLYKLSSCFIHKTTKYVDFIRLIIIIIISYFNKIKHVLIVLNKSNYSGSLLAIFTHLHKISLNSLANFAAFT